MSDRERWQARHRGLPPRPAPSAFVAAQAERVARAARGGRALDLACGSGRHAALLREQGFCTVALDHAAAACRRVADEVPGAHAVIAEAAALPFRANSFALVVQTLFLDRTIFPGLVAVLAPRGVLLVETFLVAQHETTGHPRREFCLEPGELRRLCTETGVAVRVLASHEGLVPSGESSSHLASIAVCKV